MSELRPEPNFQFNSLQGVIFSNAPIAGGKILGKILAKFSDRFDGAPTVLPIPNDAPAEIPRMILQSADSQWAVDVAQNRVNFRWVQMKEDQQQIPEDFQKLYLEFIEHLFQIESIQVGRAAVLIFRYKKTETPATQIAKLGFNEAFQSKVQAGLDGCEFHIQQKVQLAQRDVNEIIRLKSGLLNLPNTAPRKIFLVEHDLSTLAEDAASKPLSIPALSEFTSSAFAEAQARFHSLVEI
jgi:hypothetical protein